MFKHLSITIKGFVQGVSLRSNVKNKAEDLGVKGFIENQPDGSVLIEAEGDELDLLVLFEYIKEGPGMAEPEKIKYHFSDNLQDFSEFIIKG